MFDSLIFHFPHRATEWLLSFLMLSWAIAIMHAPSEAFSTAIYLPLEVYAPMTSWGLFCFLLGCARLSALFINGTMRRSPHARAACAFIAAFLWMQLAMGAINAGFVMPSTVVYPWLFFVEVFNVFRAARDARAADNLFKAMRGAPGHAKSAQC